MKHYTTFMQHLTVEQADEITMRRYDKNESVAKIQDMMQITPGWVVPKYIAYYQIESEKRREYREKMETNRQFFTENYDDIVKMSKMGWSATRISNEIGCSVKLLRSYIRSRDIKCAPMCGEELSDIQRKKAYMTNKKKTSPTRKPNMSATAMLAFGMRAN